MFVIDISEWIAVENEDMVFMNNETGDSIDDNQYVALDQTERQNYVVESFDDMRKLAHDGDIVDFSFSIEED